MNLHVVSLTRMLWMTVWVRLSTRVCPAVMKMSLLAERAAAASDASCSDTTLNTCTPPPHHVSTTGRITPHYSLNGHACVHG